MERKHLVRDDFPRAHGTEGFDVDSIGAHLAAVAAHVAALEARIAALEVERDTLRRQLVETGGHEESPDGLPGPGRGPLDEPGGEDEEAPVRQVPTDPGPGPGDGAESGEEVVAARLLASRLAIEGKSRDTIVMQLAAGHEIEDPGALVDDVLSRLA